MIVLSGNPISTGTLYRSSCRGNFPTMYMTPEGKNRKEQYQWEAQTQWKEGIIKGEIKVAVELYFKDKRRRDVDNYNKILLDALTGIVWEDDSQIQELTIAKYVDKSNPRIEVMVYHK